MYKERALSLALGLILALSGCNSAKVTKQSDLGAVPTSRPAIVYVADFDLDPGEIQSGSGVSSLLANRPLGGSILPHPFGLLPKDKATTARDLVDTMANSVVKDLKSEGFDAQRVSSEEQLPKQGWLLRGIFTEVDEGNRLRRAIIGFGAGKTDLQVATTLDDLSLGSPRPFYEVDTTAQSGNMPGAVITMNPTVAVVRFVLAGGDLNRNAKDTATQIAKSVAARVPK
jgi:hypothetical protein